MKFFSPDNFNENQLSGSAICHYEITKAETDNQDFERLDEFMEKVNSYGALARQKIRFSFSGYDGDKRELIYIPEAVSYAKKLISKYPYFWYYAIPYNSSFFYLIVFLDDKNMTIVNYPAAQSLYIKQDANSVMRFIKIMAMNLNIFGEEIDDIDGSVACLKLWSDEILKGNM